jgi:DNA-directed RNA polymerase subunit RPC12/RpoP
MKELTKAQKRDVGASLVWSVLNSINGHLEQLDQKYLEMTRILLEHRRWLDTLGITVDHHRKILSKNDTEINMWCISCRYEFKLPRQEAEAQEYAVACPKCGSWALLKDRISQDFSIQDIAQISGFAYSTVCQVMRENGLKATGEKWHRYSEETAQNVLAILETKKYGGNHGSQGTYRGANVSDDREDRDAGGEQRSDVA